jgi:hypothetical protein
MTRPQLRRLFNNHYGEAARLARELDVSRGTISRWLLGFIESKRVETAVTRRAQELKAARQPGR